ncbi:uncharacterized protein [Halyomorpha halys]|uniref:uncharacterized protein n=1 Tax=Halyomorpha halys TaxID=286706 RepID=UPI0006D4DC71|nr:uncharacterized protein LOC106690866 [Halyomorpha halys]
MIKYMGSKGQEMFLYLLNLIWKEQRIPKELEVAVIVPIYKNGDNRECGNHRGISLLSIPSKVYSKVLETRIRILVDSQLGEEQYGFRAQQSTQDLIFAMRQITEKTVEKIKELSISLWTFKRFSTG